MTIGEVMSERRSRTPEYQRVTRCSASIDRAEDACRARDLPPCAERNVKKSLACIWQVVTDLDLEFEQLYDLGV